MSLYIGIDTSNYTTSVACAGNEQANIRKIIDIKEGDCGIRQSDGVFVHMKTLPELYETLDIDMNDVRAVGVSDKPRNQEGSYMPVFVAGESFAKVVAKSLGVPLFRYSHQDGHIMAGIVSGGFEELLEGDFTVVHLSGGTTEILKCAYNGRGFDADIIGGTKDISAGQLIDRLGVALGMKFPCGKQADKLSLEAKSALPLKICVQGGYMNFSGIETQLKRMTENEDAAILVRTALEFVARSLKKALINLNSNRILFVGGVASNTIIRKYLEENLSARLYFASVELSSDNAVGIAELARREEKKWSR